MVVLKKKVIVDILQGKMRAEQNKIGCFLLQRTTCTGSLHCLGIYDAPKPTFKQNATLQQLETKTIIFFCFSQFLCGNMYVSLKVSLNIQEIPCSILKCSKIKRFEFVE